MAEIQQEQLHLLKALAESSGWKIRLDQQAKWLGNKEREKARFLRLGKYHEAALEQGKIDGVSEFEKYLDTYVVGLTDPQED